MSWRGGRGRGHAWWNMTGRGRGQGLCAGRDNSNNKRSSMETIKSTSTAYSQMTESKKEAWQNQSLLKQMMQCVLYFGWYISDKGYDYKQILHQNYRSAMLLDSNGCNSAGKHSRHINIRNFFISDTKEKGQLSIRYCPTDKLVADYMTKPLHGSKFKEFRQQIMKLCTSTIG